MSEYTVFPNAPITEALLDIRVELPKEIILENLETFHDHETVKEHFPVKKSENRLKVVLRFLQEGRFLHFQLQVGLMDIFSNHLLKRKLFRQELMVTLSIN